MSYCNRRWKTRRYFSYSRSHLTAVLTFSKHVVWQVRVLNEYEIRGIKSIGPCPRWKQALFHLHVIAEMIGFKGLETVGQRKWQKCFISPLSALRLVFVGRRSRCPQCRCCQLYKHVRAASVTGRGLRTECWSSHSQSGHTPATLTHFITCSIFQLLFSATQPTTSKINSFKYNNA